MLTVQESLALLGEEGPPPDSVLLVAASQLSNASGPEWTHWEGWSCHLAGAVAAAACLS